ncbi:hypothetical protein GCM10010329_45800 [Streptomyces spiroverticillatus]|uniref:Nickel transporter n=1 Tax=Streptomyces finlayi TaxID=67296 RepID=A0A919CBD9_9ACTN|nr:High-affinity nickel-transporter [Streptomyces finlayi]GHA17568.1 hypothetical protein GCM10010329_45800 [Streptomyces spiroverticillatus]GHC99433.1 hypothetical protein GCM10010334_42970 [Streptomyces finlayi]
MRRFTPLLSVVAAAALCTITGPAAAAGTGVEAAAPAHPLGNFTVNRYDRLRLLPDRIEDTAVTDSAEIPTAQDRAAADTDHDGRISPAESQARARTRCAEVARDVRASVNGNPVAWHLTRQSLAYSPGEAGLPVARLTCELSAPADLSRTGTPVTFRTGADPQRLGWKEVTAEADGEVRLTASDVPAQSVSGALRSYPQDRLDNPLNVTAAALRTTPGTSPAAAQQAAPAAPATTSPAFLGALESRLTAWTGSRDLTLPVGLFAVLVSLLLGAGHALLPGHAKLAVAACLAHRKDGVRAALAVGTTVTVTHTAGVLVLGLLLTASAGLAGERVLGWLGAVGGVLITVIGGQLVLAAIRALRGRPTHTHGHSHGHHHGHDHDHTHTHTHTHSHSHSMSRSSLLGIGLAGGLVPSPSALVVLLGAIALGRTYFGVLLVIGYGLGMALTLTAAGMLLAGGGNRLASASARRLPSLRRFAPYGSLATSLAMLTVGAGLTARSLLVW